MPYNQFKVTAIVAIRNGAYYFPRLCQHARNQGFSLAVIDNESEDNLQHLIEDNSDIVTRSIMLEYDGTFDLVKQLEAKEQAAETIDSDWIIHLDVDELLFSDVKAETLATSLLRVQEAGFNAVNFDEFVFLPIERLKRFSSHNYDTMSWYYFFEPRPNRLIRAFRRSLKTEVRSGGHNVEGNIRLYPKNMIMRHYMFENRRHAQQKYRLRSYSPQDLQNNFHGNRLPLQHKDIKFPKQAQLHKANSASWNLDTSNPKLKHFWEW